MLSGCIRRERSEVTMNVLDLFCGAGGMSLGFMRAGYNIKAGVDNWPHAIECYSQNFPGHAAYQMDLQDWKAVVKKFQGEQFDIVIGGPPCQDFSEAGEQIEGDRANLTKNFARIVAKLRPEYFVMENVPRAQLSNAYKTAKGVFKRAKYGLTEIVLDASLWGVPQRRKRFFCIGSLKHKNGFLKKMLLANQGDLPMTLRDYLGDELGLQYYYRHPRTYARRAVYSIDEPAPTVRGCNRPMPATYRKHQDDVVDPITMDVRALTFRERARIQMFPPDYKWSSQSQDNDQMVGNAVPVGLAEYVGMCLRKFLEGSDQGVPLTFVEWQRKFKRLKVDAACDNLSRYRRARRMLLSVKGDDSEFLSVLVKNVEYNALSHSIKSHLHRACELHIEYTQYVKELQK